MIYGSVTVPIDYIKKEKAEAVVSHSLPTPVGYGLQPCPLPASEKIELIRIKKLVGIK
jgi:hypothetical protein